jgi:hypothetical protein
MVEEVGISCGIYQAILTEYSEMRHISAKFIPCLKTQYQEENHLTLAPDMLECAEINENFLKN